MTWWQWLLAGAGMSFLVVGANAATWWQWLFLVAGVSFVMVAGLTKGERS